MRTHRNSNSEIPEQTKLLTSQTNAIYGSVKEIMLRYAKYRQLLADVDWNQIISSGDLNIVVKQLQILLLSRQSFHSKQNSDNLAQMNLNG